MDETVSTFSILSGLIKGFSYYTLAQIFHLAVAAFSSRWLPKLWQGLLPGVYWVRIDTKTATWKPREEKKMHNDWVHRPWWPLEVFIGRLVIESCSRIKYKMTCTSSNKAVGQTPDMFADIYVLVRVNCHSFKSRLLSLQTHRLY